MKVWQIDRLDDGRIELTAPNGIVLFRVSPDTAEMLGQMLLDESRDSEWGFPVTTDGRHEEWKSWQ